jgi:hypothetical protein
MVKAGKESFEWSKGKLEKADISVIHHQPRVEATAER